MGLIERIKFIKSKYGIKGLGLIDPVDINKIAQKYREGIAEFLGVPVEWIREDVARKWAEHYVKAMISPEHWEEALRGMLEAESEIIRSVGRR